MNPFRCYLPNGVIKKIKDRLIPLFLSPLCYIPLSMFEVAQLRMQALISHKSEDNSSAINNWTFDEAVS